MSAPPVAAWNRRLARLARRLWRGRHTSRWPLASIILRPSLGDHVVSVYGPRLARNWADITFAYCAAGAYGPWFADLLSARTARFALIDIGANQGLYSLVAAANPKAGPIHAIEPVPATFRRLTRNIALNDADVTAHNLAIAAADGTATIHLEPSHSGAAGFATQGRPVTVDTRDRGFLDQLAATLAVPAIVKIDVEGAEATVAAELVNSTLIERTTHVFIEVRDDTRPAVARQLEAAGLKLVHQEGADTVHDLMFARDTAGT